MNNILKFITMLLVVTAVVFAAGCAGKSAGNTTPSPVVISENVTKNNTTQVNATVGTKQHVAETGNVAKADSGKPISLKKGDNFTLKLREKPSTGYSWTLSLSQGLSILSDNYTQDPAPPDYTGVSGTHLWTIKAMTEGNQQIKGIYKRPWENITGTEDNFTLNVEVA